MIEFKLFSIVPDSWDLKPFEIHVFAIVFSSIRFEHETMPFVFFFVFDDRFRNCHVAISFLVFSDP